ncbi:MAG: hypothetical protein QM488_12785 [Rhizobiaceae bacterium]
MTVAARLQVLERENAELRDSIEVLVEEAKLRESTFLHEEWFPDPALKIQSLQIAVCRAFLHRRTPTAELIYRHCYGLHECEIDITVVQQHISRLRKKLLPYGISIRCFRHSHYEMSAENVETLRSLSNLKNVQVPK